MTRTNLYLGPGSRVPARRGRRIGSTERFVAYGEDKDLLPYRTNSRYTDHSLKNIARRLADDVNSGRDNFDEHAADLWVDVWLYCWQGLTSAVRTFHENSQGVSLHSPRTSTFNRCSSEPAVSMRAWDCSGRRKHRR